MKKIVKWAFAYFLIGIGVVLFLSKMKNDNIWYPYYEIKDSINVLVNDKEYENVELSNFDFSGLKKGDKLELCFQVEELQIVQPMLTVLTYHCNVRAYDNGQIMYEYGWEDGKRIAPSGKHKIPLQKTEDHYIRIYLEVLENNAFNSIDMLEIHESSTYFKEFLRQNVSGVGIGIFMIALGILIPLIIIAIGKIGEQYRKALWLGCFCVLAGIWLECEINLMEFYIKDLYLVSELKFISLYLCILPMLMFCRETFHDKKKKKIVGISAIGFCVIGAVVMIQHFMGIYTFAANLINYQLSAFVCMGIIFFLAISECKAEENSERIFCQGVCFLCCCVALELIRFNVDKYFFLKNGVLKFDFIYFIFLVFVIIMLHSYTMSFIEYYSKRRKMEALEKLSSTDMLTDVSTRMQCNKKIENLKERKQKDFTVILFDLNYLKHINERFGHEMGDGYIYEFAQILRHTFEGCYLLGRMSGDEFLVVLEKDDMSKEKEYLDIVNAYTKEYNVDKEKVIRISYAVGSASSTSREPMDFWAVYDLADDRMHECKKRIKANK